MARDGDAVRHGGDADAAAREAYSADRQRYFDDVMSFRPAHALAAHRPLGSVMRARFPSKVTPASQHPVRRSPARLNC